MVSLRGYLWHRAASVELTAVTHSVVESETTYIVMPIRRCLFCVLYALN
jgi:hypothetical protein